ncbi:MAG: iron-sulfur cluster assembly scaffold protein [Spirochaetes bacterium]|uniref:Iron-sulfur cluster assembly scaffold protein n=1 Tax=Candidatus Aphodenecus pullistercoris TaxID=2840669 RepID=A0A9D9EC69_9SPIR|nr:iron-sulfur cluster assembly scaffold protein [Candidatus Aphodenecus pullistercoris]
MAQWVYTDTVKDHFMNPRNLWKEGEDFQPDGVGEVGSLACGDQMRVGIKVKDGKISDLRWLTYGCASAIASTSMMSTLAIGMSLEEAYHLTPQMIMEALGGLPEHKFHCSVLGDKALRAAIDDYLEKTGQDNPFKARVARIICECKGITDVQIEELVKSGKCLTFDQLSAETGCSTVCGKCRGEIISTLEELKHIYGKD